MQQRAYGCIRKYKKTYTIMNKQEEKNEANNRRFIN